MQENPPHWLALPVVSDGLGRLLPRRRAAPASPPDSTAALPETLPPWQLRRSHKRRSIGFCVNAQGVTVHAPAWLPMAAIHAAVQEKSDWITRQFARLRQQQAALPRIHWGHGGTLAWRGQRLQLHLEPSEPTCAGAAACQSLPGGGFVLHLPLAHTAPAAQVRARVQAWMQQQARHWFGARLRHYAPLLGVQWRTLRLSSARTRWGSASSSGTISLHWRLMQQAESVIDYVVVHELAHLRHMDHSARFWACVASVLPDWQAQRRALRDTRLPPWE